LPTYPPSKEMDAKLRDEEARRCVHIYPFPFLLDVNADIDIFESLYRPVINQQSLQNFTSPTYALFGYMGFIPGRE